MPTLDASFPAIASALADRYGRPSPPTVEADPFVRLLAVALALAVDARKVEAAVGGLREGGLAEPDALAGADPLEIAEATRQAGARLPAPVVRTLKRLAAWIVDRHKGSAEGLADLPTDRLRDELVALNGIGPPTADALLLFALGRPVYPVDRASYRILVRHGWLDPTADYDEARSALEQAADGDPDAIMRLSVGLERVGREFCKPSVAHCDRCPLRPFLPESGPVEPEF